MEDFFDNMEEHSLVKATIVEKYFGAWSKIMINMCNEIGYIDLYSGAGIYDDGRESTPIKILKQCIGNEKLSRGINCVFNDSNKDTVERLKKNIESIEGIEGLRNKPIVNNAVVGETITKQFEEMKMIPCFSFVDPFGYKGLSKRLISSLVKDWGCDCVFFLNYNRINAAVTNDKVKTLINEIFGEECANKVRVNVNGMEAKEREAFIINELCTELSGKGKKYVLPFRFQSEKQNRTSHYLIFVSKNFLGYDIMKDIMCRESSQVIDGVGSFSYIPTENQQLDFISMLNTPLDDLEQMLVKEMPKNKSIVVKELYRRHSVGLPFILKNYKQVLLNLEERNKIKVIGKSAKRRKGKMNEENRVIFL